MSTQEQSEENTQDIPTFVGISHDTGDLVLSLRKGRDAKQVDTEFRVHRAIISLHSSVLRDLVDSANPNEHVDGCPVIPCYGDSAEDFRALLMALYNGLAILQEKLALDALLATLRLTDKYQMEALHRGVTRILFENWPLNYDDYVTRQKYFDSQGFRVLDSMKLIHSAQQCKVWELLPTAFYEVAATRQLDWTDIELSASEKYLTQQDFSRMLKGRERAVNRLLPLVQWTSPPLEWNPDNTFGPTSLLHRGQQMGLRGCFYRKKSVDGIFLCPTISSALFNAISVHLFHGKSPLGLLMDLKRTDFEAAGICTPCVEWLFQCVLENKKMELWYNVSADFDLPKVDPKLYSERTFPHSLISR